MSIAIQKCLEDIGRHGHFQAPLCKVGRIERAMEFTKTGLNCEEVVPFLFLLRIVGQLNYSLVTYDIDCKMLVNPPRSNAAKYPKSLDNPVKMIFQKNNLSKIYRDNQAKLKAN